MPEHIGVIEEAGFKPKKPPKTGQNFCLKVNGWDGTYFIQEEQEQFRILAISRMGKGIKVIYEQNGKYRNVNSLEAAEIAPSPISPHGEANGKAEMTKEDWERIRRIEQRGWIAKALCESDFGFTEVMADRMFAWVYEVPQNPATRPQEGKKAELIDKLQLIKQLNQLRAKKNQEGVPLKAIETVIAKYSPSGKPDVRDMDNSQIEMACQDIEAMKK